MVVSKKIAVLCNYKLMPERVGGMDHFFWMFDARCKAEGITVDWFFPNKAVHGSYANLNLISTEGETPETFFLRNYQQEYSHIITHFIELCTPFFKSVSKKGHAKIIAVDHNPRPIGGYPLKKKLVKKVKGILFSRYIDVFVGVSGYTVNEILKDFGPHLKGKTQVIYNGVIIDDIMVRQDRKTEKPTFLVASHLRQSKGIQDLIDAVQLLPETIKNEIRIAVYGDGPYKEQLVQKVKALQLESNFEFKGNQANLNETYHQYDYMLQPTYMECFSLSILESLAANVPVITTHVGGNTEAVTHKENGYIFPPKDIKALQQIISGLYTGEMRIQINTRQAVEAQFSLDSMVDNHFKLLQ